jgi:hypothetical protein
MVEIVAFCGTNEFKYRSIFREGFGLPKEELDALAKIQFNYTIITLVAV